MELKRRQFHLLLGFFLWYGVTLNGWVSAQQATRPEGLIPHPVAVVPKELGDSNQKTGTPVFLRDGMPEKSATSSINTGERKTVVSRRRWHRAVFRPRRRPTPMKRAVIHSKPVIQEKKPLAQEKKPTVLKSVASSEPLKSVSNSSSLLSSTALPSTEDRSPSPELEKPDKPLWVVTLALLAKLGLVVGLIYLTVFGLKKTLFKGHVMTLGGKKQIQILETASLGPNRDLYLVEIEKKKLILGATGSQIQVLSELDTGDRMVNTPSRIPQTSDDAISFSDTLTRLFQGDTGKGDTVSTVNTTPVSTPSQNHKDSVVVLQEKLAKLKLEKNKDT